MNATEAINRIKNAIAGRAPPRSTQKESTVNATEAINRIKNAAEAINKIKIAVDASPRNGWTAELHLQIIKYSDVLQHMTGKEFCEALGIGSAYGAEFSKMIKISERLTRAGLDLQKI